jgi:hypothetical protein
MAGFVIDSWPADISNFVRIVSPISAAALPLRKAVKKW